MFPVSSQTSLAEYWRLPLMPPQVKLFIHLLCCWHLLIVSAAALLEAEKAIDKTFMNCFCLDSFIWYKSVIGERSSNTSTARSGKRTTHFSHIKQRWRSVMRISERLMKKSDSRSTCLFSSESRRDGERHLQAGTLSWVNSQPKSN